MRPTLGLSLGLALGLTLAMAAPLTAFARPAPHRKHAHEPAQEKLLAVMKPSMLAREVPAFEAVAGTPTKIWPDGRRDYAVDGCAITALTAGSTVTGLKLVLDKTCTVDLNTFFLFAFDFPTANKLTLGEFGRMLGNNKITADCLDACPDGAPPTLHEHFISSGVLGQMQVKLDVVIDDDTRRAALDRWVAAMRDGGGPDYLAKARYQCDARFDPAAVEAFDKIKLSAISIGYNLPAPKC